jgi:hypothetical protein
MLVPFGMSRITSHICFEDALSSGVFAIGYLFSYHVSLNGECKFYEVWPGIQLDYLACKVIHTSKVTCFAIIRFSANKAKQSPGFFRPLSFP